MVAISFLFDTDLELEALNSGKEAKTCFVAAFEALSSVAASQNNLVSPLVEIPLREFIEYVPQDKMVFYHGSETVPDCSETVSWIVNLHPHVITKAQVNELASLLDPAIV